MSDHANVFDSLRSIKPTLRKVSKYENKFTKLQKKAAEFNFRNQLKQVKKKEFTMEEEDKEVNYFSHHNIKCTYMFIHLHALFSSHLKVIVKFHKYISKQKLVIEGRMSFKFKKAVSLYNR